MKKIACLLALVCLLFALPSCGTSTYTRSFFMMDTTVTVTVYAAKKADAEEAFSGCREILGELDRELWSRQEKDSEIARFNASESGLELDARTAALVEKALLVGEATGGSFDVTLAGISDYWQICAEENRLPTDSEMQALLSHTGQEKLTLSGKYLSKSDPELTVDLGGIGKGAAIEVLVDYLKTQSLSGGIVSFGSNVAVFGEKPNRKPFKVAIRDPKDEGGTVGTLTLLPGQILSVSGDYERVVTILGEDYHHILSPETGYPARAGLSSVAVVCSDGAIADALSTALFVLGEEASRSLQEHFTPSFEAVFIGTDGSVTLTDGLHFTDSSES